MRPPAISFTEIHCGDRSIDRTLFSSGLMTGSHCYHVSTCTVQAHSDGLHSEARTVLESSYMHLFMDKSEGQASYCRDSMYMQQDH